MLITKISRRRVGKSAEYFPKIFDKGSIFGYNLRHEVHRSLTGKEYT